MLVKKVLEIIPQGKIKYIHVASEDPRNYRVDFSRIHRELNFRITKKVTDGIIEVKRLLDSGLITDPFSSKYSNS